MKRRVLITLGLFVVMIPFIACNNDDPTPDNQPPATNVPPVTSDSTEVGEPSKTPDSTCGVERSATEDGFVLKYKEEYSSLNKDLDYYIEDHNMSFLDEDIYKKLELSLPENVIPFNNIVSRVGDWRMAYGYPYIINSKKELSKLTMWNLDIDYDEYSLIAIAVGFQGSLYCKLNVTQTNGEYIVELSEYMPDLHHLLVHMGVILLQIPKADSETVVKFTWMEYRELYE